MNRVFVDTSAVIALLAPSDAAHEPARLVFEKLRAAGASLLTTSYVLVETYALVQSRLGPEAVRGLREGFGPLLEVIWVDAPLHERALDDLIRRDTRRLSLVDAASFAVMRDLKVDRAFAFDRDFEAEGFATLT